jgi:hypothetical protein
MRHPACLVQQAVRKVATKAAEVGVAVGPLAALESNSAIKHLCLQTCKALPPE